MNKRLFSILSVMLICLVSVLAALTPQEEYIKKYSAIAVEEMYRSGVPASITLAQGLLESRYGQSALAAKGNNHFGIKCHNDWKGKTMKVDDDKKGECFRVYKNPEESFRDHSDFLRYKDRYKFLFDYQITDYKAWANGLKKAGYATDPQYPQKLIDLIERYRLYEYDTVASPSKARKKDKGKKEEDLTAIPESPLALEEAVVYKSSPMRGDESVRISLSRQLLSKNGVPFVYSAQGETYKSIAKDNHLLLRELLSYNDLKKDTELQPGTVVYLDHKKKSTRKGLDKYIVEEDGESLRDICQRFAVKESSVRKMNRIKKGDVYLREGDTIFLRGKKPKN